MAGHIPLVRDNLIGGAEALRLAEKCLNQKRSVMIFPEGTRSPDGRIHGFNDGAFYLAIKAGVAILPIALVGSYKCFHQGKARSEEGIEMFLKVFSPISTSSMTSKDVIAVKANVRQMIIEQVAEWRSVGPKQWMVL